jgi:hypothetical protein
VIAGAEKSKAGCARRRTGKVSKDQGSNPCTSKNAQYQTFLSAVGDELGGIKRLIPLCNKRYVAVSGDDLACPSESVDAPDASGLWSYPQLQVLGAEAGVKFVTMTD